MLAKIPPWPDPCTAGGLRSTSRRVASSDRMAAQRPDARGSGRRIDGRLLPRCSALRHFALPCGQGCAGPAVSSAAW